MLQYFEVKNFCEIEVHPPILQEDIQNIQNLLKESHYGYKVTFGLIYNIPSDLTHLLYNEIFHNKVNITIITHKSKLNKYLHRLGFNSSFIFRF